MTGSEKQVLMIVRELGQAGKKSISRRVKVSQAYIERVCANLIEDGYLKEPSAGIYSLTHKGRIALEPYRGGVFGRVTVSGYP